MRADTRIDHLERIQRVVQQIRSEPERTLSLVDIADIAALSPFHVIRVFRQLTGYTPAGMQTALRIQQAKRLLAAEHATVTDACFDVGFSSLGSFSQRFTMLAGLTPSEYRSSLSRVDDLAETLTRLHRAPINGLVDPNTVGGRLIGQHVPGAFYFVGLFPVGPPQGRPIVGDTLRESGDYVIRHVLDGIYSIYSAVVAVPKRSLDWVLPDTECASGGGQIIRMNGGSPVTGIDIELFPRSTIVTPIMTTLMALPDLAQRAQYNLR